MKQASRLSAAQRLACVVALSALACACTLLMDFPVDQCAVDAECNRFGVGLRCAGGTCVARAETADASSSTDGGAECVTHQQCIDANFGEPFRCLRGRCVGLKLPGACDYVAPLPSPEVGNDATVLLGAFLPLGGAAALTKPIALAYQLALDEVRKAGGLPAGLGPRRPVAVVFCDSDPARVEAGVKHLAQTLQVPGVLTLFSQTDMTRLFQDYLLPANVFTLNPQDTTEALKRVDAKKLLWHLLGTPEDVAKAYKPLIARVERVVQAQPQFVGPLRLALVTSESPTEEAIAAVVKDTIVFNGGTVAANETALPARFLAVKVPSLETTSNATFAESIDKIVAFRPHVIVSLTASETGQILPLIDRRLAADLGAANAPRYVLSVRNASNGPLLAFLGDGTVQSGEEKRKRFVGVQYAGADNKDQYTRYLARFADKYPQVSQVEYRATENFYDAMYWMVYGAFAAQAGSVTGPDIANGVRKLLDGPTVYPGTVKNISDAFVTIANSSTGVTFQGSLGTPNFDTRSGAQRSVGAVYCYTREGPVYGPRYDVLRFNSTTQALDGDFDCFVGF